MTAAAPKPDDETVDAPLTADKSTLWTERSREVARLLGRTGLGDRAAFSTLYERTSSHLFAVVLRINRDRAQAEDTLQEGVRQRLACRKKIRCHTKPAADLVDEHCAQPRHRQLAAQPSAAASPALWRLKWRRRRRGRFRVRPLCRPRSRAARVVEPGVGRACARRLPVSLECAATAKRGVGVLSRPQPRRGRDQMKQPLGTVKSWVRRSLLTLKECLQSAVRRDVGLGDA